MQQWWKHYQGVLPTLTDGDRKEVEDITGCIPLLLRALLRYPGRDFKSVESNFLSEVELQNVIDQVQNFTDEKKFVMNSMEWQT